MFQVDDGIDVDLRSHLFGHDIFGRQLHETVRKRLQILFAQ